MNECGIWKHWQLRIGVWTGCASRLLSTIVPGVGLFFGGLPCIAGGLAAFWFYSYWMSTETPSLVRTRSVSRYCQVTLWRDTIAPHGKPLGYRKRVKDLARTEDLGPYASELWAADTQGLLLEYWGRQARLSPLDGSTFQNQSSCLFSQVYMMKSNTEFLIKQKWMMLYQFARALLTKKKKKKSQTGQLKQQEFIFSMF